MDLAPTFCEMAGADDMPLVDGRSIVGLLQRSAHAAIFTETRSEPVDGVSASGRL
jgi:hypothetical protein